MSVVSWVAPAPCGERAGGSSSCSRGTLLIPTIQGVVSTVRSSSRATIPRYITAYHGYWIRKNMTKRKGADSSAVWCIHVLRSHAHCTVLTPRLPQRVADAPARHGVRVRSRLRPPRAQNMLARRGTIKDQPQQAHAERQHRTCTHASMQRAQACSTHAPMHPRANRVHPGSSSVADQRMNAAWEAWSC